MTDTISKVLSVAEPLAPRTSGSGLDLNHAVDLLKHDLYRLIDLIHSHADVDLSKSATALSTTAATLASSVRIQSANARRRVDEDFRANPVGAAVAIAAAALAGAVGLIVVLSLARRRAVGR